MSEAAYQNVVDTLDFFEKAFEDIQSAVSKHIYINLPEDCKDLMNSDPLSCLIEIDLLKKEFPDTYSKYFRSFSKRYLRLSKWIKELTEMLAIQKKFDRENNLNVKVRHKIGAEIVLFKLDECVEIIIKHLQELSMMEDTNKIELKESQEQIKNPKGKPLFTREQIALLFFYLREKQLIAQPTNGNMAKAIQLLTGHSAKQIQDILKSAGTPTYQLGKDNDKVTRNDFKTVISEFEKLIELIKKDFATYSDNGELK